MDLWNAPLVPCHRCNGVGTWDAHPDEAWPNENVSKFSSGGRAWWQCIPCQGAGLSSGGRRCGSRAQRFTPGFSHCYRCLSPWAFVENHTTYYSDSSGCFPLCELCWGELSPVERLPFYRELLDSWTAKAEAGEGWDLPEWSDIAEAVLSGM